MKLQLPAIVVMGVSGCGKSSVAGAICDRSGARLIEGDQFHPAANVEKMRAGIALDDADRTAWLDRLADELSMTVPTGQHAVLACSALKRSYRNRLRAAVPLLGFVYLELTKAAAITRVSQRAGHFMPASLVESQFAALEPPAGEAFVLTLDAGKPASILAEQAMHWWYKQEGKLCPVGH